MWYFCIFTHTVVGIGHLSVLYMCVYVSTLKQKQLDITKPGRWIVYKQFWSPILFDIKMSNVKVGMSLLSSECQSS